MDGRLLPRTDRPRNIAAFRRNVKVLSEKKRRKERRKGGRKRGRKGGKKGGRKGGREGGREESREKGILGRNEGIFPPFVEMLKSSLRRK